MTNRTKIESLTSWLDVLLDGPIILPNEHIEAVDQIIMAEIERTTHE
jgi:hypothetical protein